MRLAVKDGARTGGEDGGHPEAVAMQTAVADGIDAPVDPHERPAPNPIGERGASEPERRELPPSHHAVLRVGQRRRRPVELS